MRRTGALITGSTSGIGRAIAHELAERGYRVVLNYARDEARAAAVSEAFHADGFDVTAVRADVTDEADVRHLIEEAERAGPIDALVNNVGDFHLKPLLETSLEEWNHVLRSNLTSTFLCCREILPAMRRRRSGRIVNVASMNAEVLRARPRTLPYAVAKAGIVLLTKTLAKTEGRFGIRVNAVAPGFVETGTFPPADVDRTIPLRRLATAQEIANAVGFLMSDGAAYINGAVLNVHGGAFL